MSRSRALALGALALGLSFAACGGDDDEPSSEPAAQKPTTISLTTTEQGDKVSLKLSGSPKAGPATINFKNEGKSPHEAQLIRVEGNHSEKEMLKALEEASSGKPIPEWFRAGGGAGTTRPGTSTSVDVELVPGTYYALDTETPEGDGEGTPAFARGGITSFKVAGTASGDLPSAPATVSAKEYSFDASGLKAGKNQIAFENTGAEPHHIIAVPMTPGATIGEVRKFLNTEKGKPPIKFEQTQSTSVIDGGTTENVELELKSGKYALLCFISDRAGGPPHAAKGMISEATVE
jgi:hypothetical protein